MIFDEIKRVLKKTGTCWVNLGDSYGTVSGSGFLNDNVRKNNESTTRINEAKQQMLIRKQRKKRQKRKNKKQRSEKR